MQGTDVACAIAPSRLSEWENELRSLETSESTFEEIIFTLRSTRTALSPRDWRNFVKTFREHHLLPALLEDPFTSRSYRRPRGYSGDAVLIDLIYGGGEGEPLVERATNLGKRLYHCGYRQRVNVATRARRDLLSAAIDQACTETPRPAILSLACGHLREAPLSQAFLAGQSGRFVALDQDRRSLRVAERTTGGRVEFVCGSIDQLIGGSLNLGRFNLIYAAGLYDYLDDATGRALTNAMTQSLEPGGRLLIGNFMPQMSAAGYMEAAMDWWLVYRTPEELHGLACGLGPELHSRTFQDSYDHLAYLEIRKVNPL